MTFEELRELVGVLFILGGLLNIFSPGRGYSPGGRANAVGIGVLLVGFGLFNATAGLQESAPAVFHIESNATVVLYVVAIGLFFFPGPWRVRSAPIASRAKGDIIEEAHHVITEAAFDQHHGDHGSFHS
jgi:hypothetical protein